MRLKVKAEGRADIYTCKKADIIEWLEDSDFKLIHNYISAMVMLGCDWTKADVVRKIEESQRIAILTGESQQHNLRHALSVIVQNELFMFDIGEIKESDLEIELAKAVGEAVK